MSGYATELTTIESGFASEWSHTPIAFGNVNFDPKTAVEWVRVNVLPADGHQISMGDNPAFRYNGIVSVQIFTKPGSGELRSSVLSDYVTAIFRAKKIGDIQFRVPVANRVGAANGWNQVNVICPYYREES